MNPSVEAHIRGAPEGSEALDDSTSLILSLQESSTYIDHLLLSLVKTSPTTGKAPSDPDNCWSGVGWGMDGEVPINVDSLQAWRGLDFNTDCLV